MELDTRKNEAKEKFKRQDIAIEVGRTLDQKTLPLTAVRKS